MKKCVVLGGNGFIGKYVCTELESHGYDVTALVRSELEGSDFPTKQVAVDLHNAEDTSTYFENTDYVVCLAPSSLPATANENIAEDVHSHVESTVRLAEYAANLGVSKFIFASSGGTVYGNNDSEILTETSNTRPISAYGASKLAIEQYLGVLERHSNTKTISLRISNPYGVGQDIRKGQGFISTVLDSYINGRTITIWGDGEVYRDFLNVSDVATAIRLALEYQGNHSVFNIGSSLGHSLNQILDTFEKITNASLQVEYEPSRNFDVRSNILCNRLAQDQMNWKPCISLEEGILRLIDHNAISSNVAA